MPRKPKPMTKLEQVLARAYLAEICKGTGDKSSIDAWAKRLAKRIYKIKISELGKL